MTATSRRAGVVLGVAVLLALPWLIRSEYYLRVTDIALVFAILVLSLNVLLGYAGQLSLGHAGFFGIGAYASALVTVNAGLPFWLGLVAAGLCAAVAGVLLGIPTLRLKGHYLALATLAFGEIMRHVFFNWKEVTRGMDGIGGLRPPSVFGWTVSSDTAFYYLLLVVVAITMLLSLRLERSKFGRALMAVRDAEIAAGSIGINVTAAKIFAFTLSAAVAGISGAFYAHLISFISPDVFVFDVSIGVLTMLLVGGTGSVGGAVFGAALLTYLPEWLRFSKAYYMLIYGAGIVAIVAFLPYGAAGLLRRRRQSTQQRPQARPAGAARVSTALTLNTTPAAADRAPLLSVEGLSKHFGGVVALDAVDLRVERGQIHALIGPNGSGKTTLLNVVSGIYRPDGGRIAFAGCSIGGATQWDIARVGIARTFQNIRLFPEMTVWQNVMAARYVRTPGGLVPVLLRLPSAVREERAIRDRAAELLAFVGLSDRLDHQAGSLPHEDQRLVEIARALATDPTLLMLDEPAAGMNSSEVNRLMERIVHLRSLGLTILLIEHNVRLVMSLADHVSVLDFGRRIADGTPNAVQNDPKVIEAYLGGDALTEVK